MTITTQGNFISIIIPANDGDEYNVIPSDQFK